VIASAIGGQGVSTNRNEQEAKTEARAEPIRLSVPGALEFRDVAVRVVGTACRLLRPSRSSFTDETSSAGRADFSQDEFSTQVVSAFSEAFNNLAIHGYKDTQTGAACRIELEIGSEDGCFVVRLTDFGQVFDPGGYLDVPDELPERGMGLFIIRSFMDEMTYVPGPPNVLTLKKKWPSSTTTTVDPSLGEQPG
jgi:serine/threonine-protein kinase RsbW